MMRVRSARVRVLLLVSLLAGRADGATVLLDVYDADGTPVSYEQFIEVMESDGAGWRNDVTYSLADGTIVSFHPLRNQGGKPAFDVSGPPVGLSLAWRTANTGYSTLFVDNGGAGFGADATVNFTYRAALDYQQKLADALVRRPLFVPTAAFTAAKNEADNLIVLATGAGDEATRGKYGQQALDALARAFESLLHDYGLQRARNTPGPHWWGVTVDRINNYVSVTASIADLVQRDAGRGYVRVVFDEGVPATTYDGIVTEMLGSNLVVVGQILDSSAMSGYSLPAFQARVQEYVDHFPQIAVWEIGNEVNGEWLGTNTIDKLEYAAAYVKAADPNDLTMLTFYWQMGTAGASGNSLFQWIADNVTPAFAANVDVVALSAYIGDAPLGIAHDEVFERLRALFPTQQIAMGELGYWEPGTTRAWWWRSRLRPDTTVRRALARHMYLANLAFDYSLGGVFWWFYYGEMWGKTALWWDVNDTYRSVYDCVDAGDGDGVCDFIDNCPEVANADQADDDADGVGNVCDICSAGSLFVPGKIQMKLGDGATDRLDVSASFSTGTAFDPVADGVHLYVSSEFVPLVDVQLGGPGAPVQFAEVNGTFRYRDPLGTAAGIVKVDFKPDKRTPGRYKIKVGGKNMDLDAVTRPDVRLEIDVPPTCMETRESGISCSWLSGGAKLRCQ